MFDDLSVVGAARSNLAFEGVGASQNTLLNEAGRQAPSCDKIVETYLCIIVNVYRDGLAGVGISSKTEVEGPDQVHGIQHLRFDY